jgi:N-acetylmuramoyl-L-alanine amidase
MNVNIQIRDREAVRTPVDRWLAILMPFAVLFGLGSQAWTQPPPAGSDTGACQRVQFLTVVDVGHTAEAVGATSARGATEFSFNLQLGQRIEGALVAAGMAKTRLMVTKGRGRSTLFERSKRANEMKADLFLSIHHDAVQDGYLQKWTYQNKLNNFSDKFAGYSIFVSNENPEINASLEAARLLGREVVARGLMFTRHHAEDINGERRRLIDDTLGIYRFDELVVLRTTRVPAVLLEAGVIVNRKEELLLSSPAYREKISAAVTAGVERFCSYVRAPKR